jgi:hypothetical protein
MVRKFYAALTLMLSASLTAFGQGQAPVATSSQQATATTPKSSFTTEIKKTIAYLEADCLVVGKIEPHSSTAFFIVKPDDRLGKDSGFEYLVTNRHAAQPGIEQGTPCQVVNYAIRMNLRDASTGDSKATNFILGPNLQWVFPDDPSVDLAVVPMAPDRSKVDFEPISTAILATEEVVKSTGIGEGDPVVYTGLFVQMPGLVKLEPIVRQGIIAMIPDEPIYTTLKHPGSLYLADVHVFEGNSGSPMFVNLGGLRNGQVKFGYDYKLLGVVSGYAHEDTDFNFQVVTTYAGKLGANSGVASVVPAKELDRLLNSPTLQTQRDAAVKNQAMNESNSSQGSSK